MTLNDDESTFAICGACNGRENRTRVASLPGCFVCPDCWAKISVSQRAAMRVAEDIGAQVTGLLDIIASELQAIREKIGAE